MEPHIYYLNIVFKLRILVFVVKETASALYCSTKTKATECKTIKWIYFINNINTCDQCTHITTEQQARDCQQSLILLFFWPPQICMVFSLALPIDRLGFLLILAKLS